MARATIANRASDFVEGLSPRWTLFSNLRNLDPPVDPNLSSTKVLSAITVIDSVQENKIGLGTQLDFKGEIGEREAVVSKEQLTMLGLKVGDSVVISYDLALLVTMYMQSTQQVLPSFMTSASSEDGTLNLNDPTV